MTNRLALIIVVIIIGLLALDYVRYDWAHTLFLARKSVALIEWMAFWR